VGLGCSRGAQEFINYCYGCQPEATEHGRLVNPVITPRFIPTCTPELLKVCASH
jgi:guanine deaminase